MTASPGMPFQVFSDTGWKLQRSARPNYGYRPEYRVIVYDRELTPAELADECARIDFGGQDPAHPVTFRGDALRSYVPDEVAVELADFSKAQVYFALTDSGD
jgi:hypothetical protein